MLRSGHPELCVSNCSVRAKEGSNLTNPNPIDRGKRMIKYYTTIFRRAVLIACVATGIKANDTDLFRCLFRPFLAVVARRRAMERSELAEEDYDAQNNNHDLRRRLDPELRIVEHGQLHSLGQERRRWSFKPTNALAGLDLKMPALCRIVGESNVQTMLLELAYTRYNFG